ncbi:hypothetical protein [Natrinema salaciae]|uniref:hypothetical protein n=1 Tax=Natrinema salaciae TaxID=1186196 RepID=UPI000B882F41|nr:hypothetical protein [Natrinema salaciae]
MDMAVSDLRRRSLTLERVESVATDATVRHVDQLDPEPLAVFYEAVTDETNLEPGEVIAFTEYYRVQRE